MLMEKFIQTDPKEISLVWVKFYMTYYPISGRGMWFNFFIEVLIQGFGGKKKGKLNHNIVREERLNFENDL